MPWTRASALDRDLICPSSGVIPAVDLRSSSTREAAEWGTMVHHWAANGEIPESARESHKSLFDKRLDAIAGRSVADAEAFRAHWWPSSGRHEVAAAVDCLAERVSRTRILPYRVSELQGSKEDTVAWRASLSDSYAAGEADYLGDVLGDIWVDDLKTGRFPPEPDCYQLKLYALCQWILHDYPARIITSVTHWPRYPADGLPQRKWGSLSSDDLLHFWGLLRTAYPARLAVLAMTPEGQQGAAIPGDHCRWCDSKTFCNKYETQQEQV